jgi:hypothetical protein
LRRPGDAGRSAAQDKEAATLNWVGGEESRSERLQFFESPIILYDGESMSTRSQILFITFAVLIVLGSVRAQSPLLTNQSSLGQFPTVEQVKAGTKGTDDVDSHARFMAALWRLNSIIIDDLVTAPNGGRYDIPPAAEAVHRRYSNAITRLSIDQPPPAARDPRYRKLEDKYEKDTAFLDALLTHFFAPKFRTDYYAWVRKPVPQSSTHGAEGPSKGGSFNPAAGAQCPKVEVSSPSEVNEGMPITFTASVIGGDRDTTPTYNWTVSAGTISSGQGTSTITVDTTGVGGMSSTATVDIGGYERRCRTTQSSTTGIRPKPQPPRKFDEYGMLTLNDRNAHLDNYAIQLQNEPTARAYVIAYGGRKSLPSAATSLMNMSKTYLVDTRGIEASRIVTLDGGYREAPTTELWIVPQDSTPPQAAPTVDPSDIKAPIKKKPVPNRRKRT